MSKGKRVYVCMAGACDRPEHDYHVSAIFNTKKEAEWYANIYNTYNLSKDGECEVQEIDVSAAHNASLFYGIVLRYDPDSDSVTRLLTHYNLDGEYTTGSQAITYKSNGGIKVLFEVYMVCGTEHNIRRDICIKEKIKRIVRRQWDLYNQTINVQRLGIKNYPLIELGEWCEKILYDGAEEIPI